MFIRTAPVLAPTGRREVAGLGQLERAVMDALWDKAAADPQATFTARDVATSLPKSAYTTVLTVLTRLVKKGFVLQIRDGKTHHYLPVSSRDEYIADLMHQALGETVDSGAALVHFARTVSDDQAVVLREILGRSTSLAESGEQE